MEVRGAAVELGNRELKRHLVCMNMCLSHDVVHIIILIIYGVGQNNRHLRNKTSKKVDVISTRGSHS